ncbi:PREDICTED: protein EMSY-LIKE 3-like isoform X2 [Lupinus angustifolius]|uniref:protein EMSY-LIKE 3-like isoform X2 n=1 Tax=Lupinus angustifolius TaxID=3871 RepID=UPI00092E2A15|nr:PREDICTED: protein EMSY-LIKE 3-like isoform X2 [Lupinus angustifolius]
MEAQIHQLEQEAYSAVLRAFKAQSDALSWDKEELITELRKELRVSDDEHRELLSRVNADEIIHCIREWRQTGCYQPARRSTSQPVHDILPSPTISASRKKQKTSDSGRHALVYDINTADETWEWVDLKEISQEDIRWEGEELGLLHRGGHSMLGRGPKKVVSRGGDILGAGRRRGHPRFQARRDFLPPQNGIGRRVMDDIELLNTDSLVKEVERIFAASPPDSIELEKAKQVLKEHEQALVDAIARIADASDGESDGEQPFLHGQLMDRG